MKTITGVASQVLVRFKVGQSTQRAFGRPLAHCELGNLVAIFVLVMYQVV